MRRSPVPAQVALPRPLPAFQPPLSPRQIYGLQGLLRYLTGLRGSVRALLPDWDDVYRSHDLLGRSGEELNRFKRGLFALDNDKPDAPLLRHLWKALFEAYFNADEIGREQMYGFFQYAYLAGGGMSFVDLQRWLLDGHDAWTSPTMVAALPGVYHLYRCSDFDRAGLPKVVRSVLLITADRAAERDVLTFKIAYITTDGHGPPLTQDIEGFLLQRIGHLQLLGTDFGYNFPFQMSVLAPTNSDPARYLTGIFTRFSRDKHIIAARVLAVRRPLQPGEPDAASAFANAAASEVGVHSYADAARMLGGDRNLLWTIDNSLDGSVLAALREPIMSLMPDDWVPPDRRNAAAGT